MTDPTLERIERLYANAYSPIPDPDTHTQDEAVAMLILAACVAAEDAAPHLYGSLHLAYEAAEGHPDEPQVIAVLDRLAEAWEADDPGEVLQACRDCEKYAAFIAGAGV